MGLPKLLAREPTGPLKLVAQNCFNSWAGLLSHCDWFPKAYIVISFLMFNPYAVVG